LDICVVGLAQLNRAVEKRTDPMPVLSDLRDSGEIEQDADVVLFVHRPIVSRPDMGMAWEDYARIGIAKQRQGKKGVIDVRYIGEQTRFANWSGPAPVQHMARAARSL